MSDLIVGLDPGKSCGLAIYSLSQRQLIELKTVDFWGVFEELQARQSSDYLRIVVEVPSSKHVWHKGGSSTGSIQRTALNVGMVIREAELLAEGLRLQGYPVDTVPPRGKVDSAKFKSITGWPGRTNAHTRDAGILAFSKGHKLHLAEDS